MTPEQQADYDYAMSQLRPKITFAKNAAVTLWERGAMPTFNITFEPKEFQDAVRTGQQKGKEFSDKMDAIMFAAMGVPQDIFFGSALNCRCTIKNNWEEKGIVTDAKTD